MSINEAIGNGRVSPGLDSRAQQPQQPQQPQQHIGHTAQRLHQVQEQRQTPKAANSANNDDNTRNNTSNNNNNVNKYNYNGNLHANYNGSNGLGFNDKSGQRTGGSGHIGKLKNSDDIMASILDSRPRIMDNSEMSKESGLTDVTFGILKDYTYGHSPNHSRNNLGLNDGNNNHKHNSTNSNGSKFNHNTLSKIKLGNNTSDHSNTYTTTNPGGLTPPTSNPGRPRKNSKLETLRENVETPLQDIAIHTQNTTTTTPGGGYTAGGGAGTGNGNGNGIGSGIEIGSSGTQLQTYGVNSTELIANSDICDGGDADSILKRNNQLKDVNLSQSTFAMLISSDVDARDAAYMQSGQQTGPVPRGVSKSKSKSDNTNTNTNTQSNEHKSDDNDVKNFHRTKGGPNSSESNQPNTGSATVTKSKNTYTLNSVNTRLLHMNSNGSGETNSDETKEESGRVQEENEKNNTHKNENIHRQMHQSDEIYLARLEQAKILRELNADYRVRFGFPGWDSGDVTIPPSTIADTSFDIESRIKHSIDSGNGSNINNGKNGKNGNQKFQD